MKKIILSVLFLVTSIALFSCGKMAYERNLDGSWVVSKYTENGTDKTADFKTALPNYTISFSKSSHTFTEIATVLFFTIAVNGNYSFESGKSQLKLTNTSPNSDVRYFNVVKIKSRSLELEETGNVAKHYYLIPK